MCIRDSNKKRAEAKGSSWAATYSNFAKKKFTTDSTMIVALLAVNDRTDEAKDFAAAAKNELEDEEFHKALESSLNGVVPDPWP